VNEATVYNCAIIFDTDQDFGHVPMLDIQFNENTTSIITNSNTYVDSSEFDDVDSVPGYAEPLTNNSHGLYSHRNVDNVDDARCVVSDVSTSSIRYSEPDYIDNNGRHTNIHVGIQVDQCKLQHLGETQRTELLHVLNEFSDCFTETPGFCPYVEHKIVVSPDFKPK